MLLPDEVRPRLKNDEAAAALGVKPATLKTWRWRGVGPAFVRVNGAIRYDPVDIAVYLGERRVEPRA